MQTTTPNSAGHNPATDTASKSPEGHQSECCLPQLFVGKEYGLDIVVVAEWGQKPEHRFLWRDEDGALCVAKGNSFHYDATTENVRMPDGGGVCELDMANGARVHILTSKKDEIEIVVDRARLWGVGDHRARDFYWDMNEQSRMDLNGMYERNFATMVLVATMISGEDHLVRDMDDLKLRRTLNQSAWVAGRELKSESELIGAVIQVRAKIAAKSSEALMEFEEEPAAA